MTENIPPDVKELSAKYEDIVRHTEQFSSLQMAFRACIMADRTARAPDRDVLVETGAVLLSLLDDYMVVTSITATARYEQALADFRRARAALSIPAERGVEEPTAHLSLDEQASMHRALRKSVDVAAPPPPAGMVRRDAIEAVRDHWCARRESFEIIGDDAAAALISAFISDLAPDNLAAPGQPAQGDGT